MTLAELGPKLIDQIAALDTEVKIERGKVRAVKVGRRPEWKRLTLQLNEQEMKALEKLADDKGMNKTAILRQALRLYQTIDLRLSRGDRLYFSGDGDKVEVLVP